MHELPRLSTAAGVKLLRTIGVRTGSRADFEKLVEDVEGHALTLQILGQFLVRAFHGDIRRRDRISFEKADVKIQGGHAFRAMKAYVKWMEDDSEEARREVALLKLLGLFDRPATADCLAALRRAPAIPGLTEPLVGLTEEDWEFSLTALRDAKLLTANWEEGSGVLLALDAHPLLREYFATQLRQKQPESWRAAHRRLYEHLCATTKDLPQPTLEDLQPLYQAVAHGCQGGLEQQAYDEVYWRRIALSWNEAYSTRKLGAFGADLGALACFFESPWAKPSAKLDERAQVILLNNTAFLLRGLGRLGEASQPLRAGLDGAVRLQEWLEAAKYASNLSELELTLGELAGAVRDAEEAWSYADRSGDAFLQMPIRATHADALHQQGRRDEAAARFREAESMQSKRQTGYPPLYSVWGFRYCDRLLAEAECAAWRACLPSPPGGRGAGGEGVLADCRAVSQRAAQTLKIAERNNWLLDIALDHLTLCRAALYAAMLEGSSLDPCRASLQQAVDGLRRSGNMDYLPRGLLTRAWLRFLEGKRTGPESAQSDLDEAWEIAERGPMKLHMADIHLHRARLFFRETQYPWESPTADLAAARELIEKCGYGRRKEELADAEAAVQNRGQG